MGSSLSSSQGRTTAIMAVPKNVVMADHFSGMQKLPDPVAGCPNFRKIPGYKIYCCGQPSLKAYTDILEKVCGKIWPKDGKIIWISARQEASVYINGEPFVQDQLTRLESLLSLAMYQGRMLKRVRLN